VGVGEGQAVAGEVVAVAFQHGAGLAVAGVGGRDYCWR
jgi:hypothetical protein